MSLRQQFGAEWQKLKAGDEIELDLSRPLAAAGTSRNGKNVATLEVAALLRVKAQPDPVDIARVVLTPPAGVLPSATDTVDLDVQFQVPVDGGARVGLVSQTVVDETTAATVSFALLRDQKWKFRYETGGVIAIDQLEDLVLCLRWELEAP